MNQTRQVLSSKNSLIPRFLHDRGHAREPDRRPPMIAMRSTKRCVSQTRDDRPGSFELVRSDVRKLWRFATRCSLNLASDERAQIVWGNFAGKREDVIFIFAKRKNTDSYVQHSKCS